MPTPVLPPFKLALGPLVFQSKSVPAHGQVTLYNQGGKPLNISSSTLHVGGTCGNLHISPEHFTLAAGTHKVITVTDTIPNADLAARFSGHVPGQGGISTSGAMAARFITGKPAGTGACAVHAVPAHVVASAGLPLWIFAVIAVAVLALAVVVIREIRKARAS